MSVLFWIVILLLAAVGLFLFTPLRLEVRVLKDKDWSSRMWLRPFGRYGPRIALSTQKRTSKDRPARRKPRSSGPQLSTRNLRAAVTFLQAVLRRIRFVNLHGEFRFGFNDPAETGEVFGALAPFVYGQSASHRLDISLEPDFFSEGLEGEAEAVFSLVPAHLFLPLAQLGWHLFGPTK